MHGTGWTGDLVAEQGSTLLDDLFLTGRNRSNAREATQFKPGQSGNPAEVSCSVGTIGRR